MSSVDLDDAIELAMEVVSEDDPDRDYVTKRSEYARAGVVEYWLVDHRQGRVTVLRLENGQYVEHGVFGPGQRAPLRACLDSAWQWTTF